MLYHRILPLQYSCLETSMDRGSWWAAVHGVAQSRTRLKRFSMHACIGEGNGNPLQYSCLENPRDRGACGLPFMGLRRVGHDWSDLAAAAAADECLGGASGKEPACQCRRYKRCGFNPWVGKIPWRRKWQPTPIFLPGESCGQRNLAGYIQSMGLKRVRRDWSDLAHMHLALGLNIPAGRSQMMSRF